MELKLQDAEMLKKILKMMQTFVKQVKFASTPASFGFNSMSETKDVFFELKIPQKSFEFYKSSPEPIIVELEYLNKILARYNKDDTLWIKENVKKNKIDMIFKSEHDRYFEISTQEEFEGIDKELKYNEAAIEALMYVKPILEAIKDIKAIEGEKLTLNGENVGAIQIKSTTNLLNDYYEYTLPGSVILEKEGSEDACSDYKLVTIESILSCGFKTAKFSWGTEFPLKLNFKNDTLEFNAIIAPMGEEDEDIDDSDLDDSDFDDGDFDDGDLD